MKISNTRGVRSVFAFVRANSEKIHRLIEELPEELRLPLVLGAYEELCSREIAAILDTSEGAIITRQRRAREILREKLRSLNSHPLIFAIPKERQLDPLISSIMATYAEPSAGLEQRILNSLAATRPAIR